MQKLVAGLLVMAISTGLARADLAPPKKKGGADPGMVQPWWDEETAGWLGGLTGGSAGLLGAVYGITSGLGVARRFVLQSTLVLACVGVAVFLAGLIALAIGQPYHVYFLPLLVGGITAVVFGVNYPVIKRRNEQMELQQMSALDS
ncbi:MAG: hypothetical protein EXR98_08310 [Gemmataceae bacterium]|nr:hypothetical protein [Gemmataceae bacterium]